MGDGQLDGQVKKAILRLCIQALLRVTPQDPVEAGDSDEAEPPEDAMTEDGRER